ncbi:Bax inhibitor-1/YccA family protein [Crenalkalicoccus roseus]|uniref:Bax inhibitor-1/YccA family protein n=1 Tax=Crenalkalicoccus roseus TaxID=1485588 RepID=UPI0010809F76|nr:Bax inhibitor-1/YccA family protein [Crenalkalicoccus roseus]
MALRPDYRYTTGAPGWGRVATADAAAVDAGLRAYMLRVYNWMASGLLLTGIVAYFVANTPELQALFYQRVMTPRGAAVQPTILAYIAMFSPLAFILVLSFGINKLSKTTAQALFWAFAAVMGLSISHIFLTFTGASIARTFFVAAAMFGAMSLYGYTTKADLTKMGSFMMMGLIGIIIAMIVNIFVGSTALQFAISVIGVIVFLGLTAWDTQRIKADYIEHAYEEGTELAGKRSVMDALALYLNFINLFMLLLQFMGVRQQD